MGTQQSARAQIILKLLWITRHVLLLRYRVNSSLTTAQTRGDPNGLTTDINRAARHRRYDAFRSENGKTSASRPEGGEQPRQEPLEIDTAAAEVVVARAVRLKEVMVRLPE